VDDGGSEILKTQASDDNLAELAPASATTAVVLGTPVGTDVPISWSVDIRSNPHLMIVGLPGMGKTTALVNICAQLAANAITPIVFSYHEDIDDQLEKRVGALNAIDYNGLGFNPMHVSRPQANAYIDNAGMIRDLFGSIFPDLGDLQLESIGMR
jgi:DNA phosphorothioation-dependent restriction protein DptH